MSIEEKAKAYDEALERARKYMAKGYDILMPEIFPELRESEDERIRKWIIEKVQGYADSGIPRSDEIQMANKALAYLEKQKEQKPAEKEITLNGFEKVLDSFLFDFVHSPIIDCEPKEYIKNHSAYLLKAAYKELNAQLKQDFFEAQQEGRREGYEAAMAEQNPAKWSEEDERILKGIIGKIDHDQTYGVSKAEMLSFLKSLRSSWKSSDVCYGVKGHPDPAGVWKPSEHQMNILKAVKEYVGRGSGYWGEALGSLIEDLEKLM